MGSYWPHGTVNVSFFHGTGTGLRKELVDERKDNVWIEESKKEWISERIAEWKKGGIEK
jgi:hypothetical protein